MDTATEAEIRKSFSTSLKDTTKLIIAQRVSSVEDADRILVMDEGEIVGQGTHKELMDECEQYREIYYSQKDKEEEVSAWVRRINHRVVRRRADMGRDIPAGMEEE